jgi:hypothetical protein
MRDERYIDIPGTRTHELPPLLVHAVAEPVQDLDGVMVEAQEMLGLNDASEEILERRRLDLAVQLAERYKGLMSHWFWGDSVLEWIRQCEITFESEGTLRKLLHPDVWPHASRASFVTLLREKGVPTTGTVALEKAVGLRLTFRQPPPIDCCSSQFLFYLNSTVADSAFQAWSHLAPLHTSLFPPERFHFDVLEMD